ncbi:hypothetical protein [Microcoleus sp. N3A4]|uniref:hypothetical protein n=1 Tax=Microcoleus sp. N3A4 TaxID=3055379 RepID=UPI002FD142B4
MKSASCQNQKSVSYRNLTHREVPVKSTIFSGDWNSFTYVCKFILLLIISTCNELQVAECKSGEAGDRN